MVAPRKTTNWLPIWVYWSLFRGEPLLLNFGRVDIFKHLLKGSILSTWLHATSVATGGQRFLRKSETSTGASVELEEDDDEDGNTAGSVFVC